MNLNNTNSREKPENEMENLSETIDRICIDIQEVEAAIESLIQQNYINIAEIDKDEERFFFIQDLAKKYKTQPFELHQHLIDITKKIDGFNKTEESFVELTKQQKVLEAQYFEIAKKLSELRTIAAKTFPKKLMNRSKSFKWKVLALISTLNKAKCEKTALISFLS